MSSSEKLCLQWNDFKESIIYSFGELKGDRDLTDVSLVCEDGQQIEAHKVVLASSSPFFMNLLKRNKHTHPLIYMRGLKSIDLVAIIDFLYVGEANVFQEDLDPFLAIAEELQLKGLTGTGEASKEPERPKNENDFVPKGEIKRTDKALYTNHTSATSHNSVTTVAVNKTTVFGDFQKLDEQIQSMITRSDVSADKGQGFLATCNVCGKEAAYQNMPRHVEANHITGVSHECDICGKMSRSAHGLRQHKKIYHMTITGFTA